MERHDRQISEVVQHIAETEYHSSFAKVNKLKPFSFESTRGYLKRLKPKQCILDDNRNYIKLFNISAAKDFALECFHDAKANSKIN